MNKVASFSSRLQKALNERDISVDDFALKIGLNRTSIYGYINEKFYPRQNRILQMSKVLDVDELWLSGYDVPMHKEETETYNIKEEILKFPKVVWIPVYGRISAGNPKLAEQEVKSYFPMDCSTINMNNVNNYFMLEIDGESMNNILPNNSIAMVEKCSSVENGEMAVVLIENDEATVKVFHQYDNIVVLEPKSSLPEYKSRSYDITQTNILILGKVIGSYVKFK